MPDKKISQLNAINDNELTLDDLIAIVDVSGNETKKVTLEQIIKKASIPTFDFPADVSLDIAQHKNHLVMRDGGVAKILNYNPAEDGTKGKYSIEVTAPQKSIGCIQELTFPANLSDGDSVKIIYFNTNTEILEIIAKNTPVNPEDIQIGATLSDTIDNIIAYAETITGTCWEYNNINGDTLRTENKNIYTGSAYILPQGYNSNLHTYNNGFIDAVITQNGVNGDYADAYVDLMTSSYNLGIFLNIENNQTYYNFYINSLLSNAVASASDYMGWNMANTDDEFAEILYNVFNAQGYFTASDLIGNGFIIEETVHQSINNELPLFIDFNKNYFYNIVETEIEVPVNGIGLHLKNRLLGSLIDVVGGIAKIASSNVITCKLSPGIDVTFNDDIDWLNPNFPNYDLIINNAILVPGQNGELVDFFTLVGLGHSLVNLDDLKYIGQVYLALENKIGGEDIKVRPILL